jgi:hypothetical protein
MPRKNFEDAMNRQQSSAKNGAGSAGMDISALMKKGLVPKEFLGIVGNSHGKSDFSSIAHGAQQQKKLDNLYNNGVNDEIVFLVKTRNDQGLLVPRTIPFDFGGKTLRPNKEGEVRITDNGKVKLAAKLAVYRKNETDKLMDIVRLGDEVAQYVFGIDPKEWERLCKPNDGKDDNMGISATLNNLDCTVDYINSLPPSLTQTQSVAKLRKIVEYHAPNVNMEELSDIADLMGNMKDGHNNASGVEPNPMIPEGQQAGGGARGEL